MSFTSAWPLLQNKCSPESCCCIGSTFGVPIPTVDQWSPGGRSSIIDLVSFDRLNTGNCHYK